MERGIEIIEALGKTSQQDLGSDGGPWVVDSRVEEQAGSSWMMCIILIFALIFPNEKNVGFGTGETWS